MSDLISRSALLDDMKNELEKATKEDLQEDECKAILTSAIALKSFVDRQPTVEAIPKEKLDEIVEKLEKELEMAESEKSRCVFQGLPYFDSVKGYVNGLHNAIATVKEVGGM